MGRVLSFKAESVAYEQGEGDHREWGKWVLYLEIVFRPGGSARRQRNALYLQRCYDDSDTHFVGPINVRFREYDGRGGEGIREAVLARQSLRLVLGPDAARAMRKDEIRVEFDLTDEQFAELRRELTAFFAGIGVYREE